MLGARELNTFCTCFLSLLFEVQTPTTLVFNTCKPNISVLTKCFVYVFSFDFTNGSNSKYKNEDIMHIRLTFRHRGFCILGQAFHYSPENAFFIFNQQIYFII